MFWVHILALLFGIGSYALALSAGVVYLAGQRALKTKQFGRFSATIPPLETLDRLAVRSLVAGFVFLSVGIVTGIYLAHILWKSVWVKDPKFIFSFVTWGWFLLLLLGRRRFGWRGGKFLALIVIGFVFLLATFLLSLLWSGPWT